MGKARGMTIRDSILSKDADLYLGSLQTLSTGLGIIPARRLQGRELQEGTPEPYGASRSEVHGALASNIVVIQ